MSKHGQEQFDGYSIDSYRGRFSGSFDVDSHVGEQIAYGDEVMVIVVAKVGKADISETAIGDMRRTNVLKPMDVTFVLGSQEQNQLKEKFGLDSLEVSGLFSEPEEIPVRFSRDPQPQDVVVTEKLGDDVLSRFLYSEA